MLIYRSSLRKSPHNPSPCQSIPQGTHFLKLQGLEPGVYNYKFIVDGAWQVDFLGPTAMDKSGNWNNVLLVDSNDCCIADKATEDLVRVEAALVALRSKGKIVWRCVIWVVGCPRCLLFVQRGFLIVVVSTSYSVDSHHVSMWEEIYLGNEHWIFDIYKWVCYDTRVRLKHIEELWNHFEHLIVWYYNGNKHADSTSNFN